MFLLFKMKEHNTFEAHAKTEKNLGLEISSHKMTIIIYRLICHRRSENMSRIFTAKSIPIFHCESRYFHCKNILYIINQL